MNPDLAGKVVVKRRDATSDGTTFHWVPGERPAEGLVVNQAYAYIRDHDGKYLLQNDRGRYNLPGGKPEVFDADEIETLRRECLEESQVAITSPVYLGYVRVEEGSDHYAQLRYLAEVAELQPTAEDPATGKTYGREFVALDAVAGRLQWGDHGLGQVETIRTMV